MCNENQLTVIIKEMVEAYRKVYGPDIQSIILYGSYARGDYDDQSDIDLAAIVYGRRADLQDKLTKVWDRASDIGMAHDAVISPVVIPLDEFMKYRDKLPYYRNIEKEGKKVG